MKGILLAENTGRERLYPLTRRVPRALLPVYDKPLVYYPLSLLMLAGIRDIRVTGSPHCLAALQDCLGDGSQWGLNFDYTQLPAPGGPLSALACAREFAAGQPVALISEETIFYGRDLVDLLREFAAIQSGAAMFAHSVRSPGEYAQVELDPQDRPLRLEDDPFPSRNGYSAPEMYFYDSEAPALAEQLLAQGCRSITALNRGYMARDLLRVVIFGRGIAWLDAHTPESLLQAAGFIQVIQERQGFMISCPEEIAYRNGWIDADQLRRLAEDAGKSGYGDYLRRVLEETPPG